MIQASKVPCSGSGRQLDAGQWSGVDDETDAILIDKHPILDEVSRTAGSVVTWVNVDDDTEWNGILSADCEIGTLECDSWRDAYSSTLGFELSTNDVSGVFGAVQGWRTNNFGPAHDTNGGPGGVETPSGVWTHVALTWNDVGDHTIYVNGVPGKTIEGVGAGQIFGQNDVARWNIGGSAILDENISDQRPRYLSGKLADFAIFNDELDRQAINDIRINGVPRPIRPVFHLDFSTSGEELADLSLENIPFEVGKSVTTSFDAPSIEGPVLRNGRQLDAGQWSGVEEEADAILIDKHPILDEVSRTAGSVVTWVNVDDDTEWNGIFSADCEIGTLGCDSWQDGYSSTLGFELSTNDVSGVFGAVQGWRTNNFGPAHGTNGGPGGVETPSGVWTHVALTWNDVGDHTIYVNGVPGKTIEGVGAGQIFGQNDVARWNIGGNAILDENISDQRPRFLSGKLADFAIFNNELDRQAVNDIRINGVPRPISSGTIPAFHLDFSTSASELADLSLENIPFEVGTSVVTSVDNPSIEGPVLRSGRQLDAGQWSGVEEEADAILIDKHPILDEVSRTAGSVVTWVNVDDDTEWNGIFSADCEIGTLGCDSWQDGYSSTLGFELSTNDVSGVFGAVQGWRTNNFGPAHGTNGGPGGVETPSGVWTHVALTWNDVGDHTIYVNGVPGETIEGVGAGQIFGQNDVARWNIGGNAILDENISDQRPRFLSGKLADFAIFNNELDQSDIHNIMHAGVGYIFEELRMGVQSFRTLATEPSVVGQRFLFEDHLGQMQLVDDGGTPYSLLGLAADNGVSRPIADAGTSAFDGEIVAFTGELPSNGETAIYVVNQFGAVNAIVDRTSTASTPGVDFDGKTFDVHAVDNGLVAFGVKTKIETDQGQVIKGNVNDQGLFATVGDGRISTLADASTRVQGSENDTPFDQFGEVELDGDTYAFRAKSGDSFAIYLSRGRERVIPIVGSTTEVPNAGGDRFTDISGFALSQGRITFHGVADTVEGIYIANDDNSIDVIADTCTPIPDTDMHFSGFGQVTSDQDRIAFVGMGMQSAVDGECQTGVFDDYGIYLSDGPANLRRIVGLNDRLDVFEDRTVVSVDMGPAALSGNRLVFFAAFDDGTEGIYAVEMPSQSKHIVRLDAGASAGDLNFGRQPLTGEITGVAYIDLNINGQREETEPGLPGWTIFLDQNGNGIADDGEPSRRSIEDGSYKFSNLPALAEYTLVAVPPADEMDNWDQTAPASGTHTVFLDANEKKININFGSRRIAGIIGEGADGVVSGKVSLQSNSGSTGKFEVFLDLNDNGVIDANEPTTPTETEGHYAFSDLAPGSYSVRLLLADDYVQTMPLGNQFIAKVNEAQLDRPSAILAAALNGDASTDLIVANNLRSEITIFANDNVARFTSTSEQVEAGPASIASADLNGDGRIDLAVANAYDDSVSILLNQGDDYRKLPRISVGNEPSGVAAGDLDGDGDTDLVIVNRLSDNLTLLLNNGDASFTAIPPLSAGDKPSGVTLTQLDDNELPDIVVSNPSANRVLTLLNVGNGSFASAASFAVDGHRPVAVVTGQLTDDNGDGEFNELDHADIVTANRFSNSVSVLLGVGDGTLATPLTLTAGKGPTAVQVVDIDIDGDQDLVAAVAGESPIAILRNNGDGTFQTRELTGAGDFPITTLPLSLAAADLDGDQDPDIAVANGDADSITVLRNVIVPGAYRVTVGENQIVENQDFTIRTVNRSPTLSLDGIGELMDGKRVVAIEEDAGIQSFTLMGITAGDGEDQLVRVVSTTNNTMLVENLAVTPRDGRDEQRLLTFKPAPDQSGDATISVTVTDAGGDGEFDTDDDASWSEVFFVEIRPVNDEPKIGEVILEQFETNSATFRQDEGDKQLLVSILDIQAGGDEVQSIELHYTSSNEDLVSLAQRRYLSPGSQALFIFQVDTTRVGTAEIVINAVDTGFDGVFGTADDGRSAPQSFNVSVIPSSMPGDFNGDGKADVHDIDDLYAAIAAFSPNQTFDPKFDLDSDEQLSSADITFMIEEILQTKLGDVNLDGAVDFSDFLELSASFGSEGGWSQGDFDGSGEIDFADFLALSRNFGYGALAGEPALLLSSVRRYR